MIDLMATISSLPKITTNSLMGRRIKGGTVIVIPGKPTPKGRPRYTRQGQCYTPKQTLDAEQFVKTVALTQIGSQLVQGRWLLSC